MKKLLIIAGPCMIENEQITYDVAKHLKQITEELNIDFIFKSSFDKANRTSINSVRGPGIKDGLNILEKIKNELDIKITTDIHEPYQADIVSKVVDVIQIPAFLCRQTDLLVAAAKTGLPINVKKAQFLAPWDMKNVINKIKESGNNNILLCERGTVFGYNNLVVDMTSIIEMKKLGYPVVFDATHSVQKPGGNGDSTGGNREYVEYLAKSAISVGADAIFMEIHPDPDNALSDGPNQIKLSDAKRIITELNRLFNFINSGDGL